VPALRPDLAALLRCPRCKGPLRLAAEQASCVCGLRFPVETGVPVLIDEERSVFTHLGILAERRMPSSRPAPSWKRGLAALIPSLGASPRTPANFVRLQRLLREDAASAGRATSRVLVVGGGVLGEGLDALVSDPTITLVESDVFLGPRNGLVCDGHDLPFEDGVFDGAVIQAVLEHVVDPARCVAELHRVLRPGALVYAETPFMQQVHLGRYDFTRFTHLGHRRLFRHFEEVASGACGGPGMALAWAWQYWLLSPWRRAWPRALARALAAFTAFPLKWLDWFLLDTPGTLDAASGVYFLGRRSERTLPDRELIAGYRGAG
jgi:SAM-dependent methyltransferase/uncharacterized protein YbaR (Trm112 family)